MLNNIPISTSTALNHSHSDLTQREFSRHCQVGNVRRAQIVLTSGFRGICYIVLADIRRMRHSCQT